jgi:hypothetical protein
MAEVSCNVTFEGNLIPTFICQPFSEVRHVSYSLSYPSATYRDRIKVTRDFRNESVFCELKFRNIWQSSTVSVTNGYLFQWRSPPVDVTCKFSKPHLHFLSYFEVDKVCISAGVIPVKDASVY